MRAGQRLSSGDLLLLELVFAIVFFSLSIAATMSVFGNAYEMSSKASARNTAVAETNSVIEIIRSSATETEADEMLQKTGFVKDDKGIYSKEYGDGKYNMKMETAVSGKLYTADVSCYYSKGESEPEADPFYSIKVEHAIKEVGADGK